METKCVLKWWWGWNPEKIERYIEKMALQGWRLTGVSGFLVMLHFSRSDSEQIRVCVDYQPRVGADYVALFEDAGWECLGQSAGWYMWRKSYEGDRPEIYSDIGSLLGRNRRIAVTLLAVLALQIPVFFVNLNSFYTRVERWRESPLALSVLVLYVAIVVMLLSALLRLLVANRRLRLR